MYKRQASVYTHSNPIEVQNAVDLGNQLSPILGDFSKYFISIGLFCAGITSSITAPIATSYALSGIFKYKAKWEDPSFKKVSYTVIIIGVLFSSLSYKPIVIIKFAQFINGLFLPLIAGFLLWSINKRKIMGDFTNSSTYNLLGIITVSYTHLTLPTICSV